jgi:hypothetical protein
MVSNGHSSHSSGKAIGDELSAHHPSHLPTPASGGPEVKHGVRIPENPAVHVSAPKLDEVKENHWKKPVPSGKKFLHVSHDALPLTARKIRQDMDDLNEAITKLKSTYQKVGSLPLWSTGQQFSGNMQAALDGFVTATEQNRGAHDVTAQNLVDTAAHYEQAETTARRAAELKDHQGHGTSGHGTPGHTGKTR